MPDELLAVLTTAGIDATRTFVTLFWRDGHEAVATSVEHIQPVEEVQGLGSIYGQFVYADDSRLKVLLLSHDNSKLTAKGPTARRRQSELSQQWAAIPNRGRVTSRAGFWAWQLALGAICGSLWALISGYLFFDVSVLGWAMRISALLLAVSAYALVRRLGNFRWRPKLVVLTRREPRKTDPWNVVSAVSAVAAVVIALAAWLYPRT